MIRVVITGPPKNGYFPYRTEGYKDGRSQFVGLSTEPLLDACRQLSKIGVMSDSVVGLFDEDQYKTEWRLRTTVGVGSKLTVREDDKSGPAFVRYQPISAAAIRARRAALPSPIDFAGDPSVGQHPDENNAPVSAPDRKSLNVGPTAKSGGPPPEPRTPPMLRDGTGQGHATPSKPVLPHRKRKRAGSGARRGSR